MIDISNRSEEEINLLIQQYAPVLELIRDRQQIPYFAVVLDIATKYIKEKYPELSQDWKTWCVFVVKGLHTTIRNEANIKKIIDEFVDYYKTQYDLYIGDMDIAFSASEFDRDLLFISTYITYITNGGKWVVNGN